MGLVLAGVGWGWERGRGREAGVLGWRAHWGRHGGGFWGTHG